MPEIKNTFLKGKMNKDLDDRLVPEGEYTNALNIKVSSSEGQNIGAIENIKSFNEIESIGTGIIIGSYYNDENNDVYLFVKDYNETGDAIIKKNIAAGSNIEILINGSFLNFSETNLITGINIVEDYLFWTDNRNQPRKINITSEAPTYTAEHQISVAKLAPFKAPGITAETQVQADIDAGETEAGSYMKEKFMRFSYRFKYNDNTYSVLAPFSTFVFNPRDTEQRYNILSRNEINSLIGATELTWFENKINRVLIEVYTNDGVIGNPLTFAEQGVKSIDIIGKASDSAAAYIFETINIDSTNSGNTSLTYKYLSNNPKSTLPESQLVRVYDKVPTKALAQEFVGNRVVYGNYEENLELPENFTLKASAELRLDTNTGGLFSFYSLKTNRTYDVGYVLSDDYGRTSPVLSLTNTRLFNKQKENLSTFNKISIKFGVDDKTEALEQIQALQNNGWKYITFVVKQDKQEYYNVYTPGFGYVDGKTYFSVFGDNINKIPVDTSTYNAETNYNTTKQKTQLSLINKTTFVRSYSSGEPITVSASEYEWENYNRADPASTSPQYVYGFTNVLGYSTGNISQNISGYTYNTDSDGNSFSNAISPSPDGSTSVFTVNSGTVPSPEAPSGTANNNYYGVGASASDNTGVIVYVDGVKKEITTEYTYDDSTVQVTFLSGHIPATGSSIVVFFTYGGFLIPDEQYRSAWSLTPITGSASRIDEISSNAIDVIVTGDDFIDITSINEDPEVNFAYGNLEEVKINGISTRNNFNAISQDLIDISENFYGLYKTENNYLLAEIDGEYGVKLYDDSGNFPISKYADLGIIELPGFESAIDIYYETPTTMNLYDLYQGIFYSAGYNSYFDINYYNAINLSVATYVNGEYRQWSWQENRLRGGFNEPYIDFGVHAYFTNPDYNKETRKASLIYSGIYNARTGVNNTNQFPIGESIEKSLDPSKGSIQKLFAEDNDIIVLQEEKVNKIPIDRDIIYTAEGSPQLTAANRVFGDVMAYAGNYGIGKNPESFAHYGGRKYFVDKPKGAVLRLSRDGITEISNYGMTSYFRDNLRYASKIYGSWDMRHKNYIVSLEGTAANFTDYDSEHSYFSQGTRTLSFREAINGWSSFLDIPAKLAGSLDAKYIALNNASGTSGLVINYEGDDYLAAEVSLIINPSASVNKVFQTLNYEGTEGWEVIDISTDVDKALDISKYSNTLDTDLYFHISKFDNVEGKFCTNIINNTTEKTGEIVYSKDISGIKGFFTKLTIKTSDNIFRELFAVSSNYNVNTY